MLMFHVKPYSLFATNWKCIPINKTTIITLFFLKSHSKYTEVPEFQPPSKTAVFYLSGRTVTIKTTLL